MKTLSKKLFILCLVAVFVTGCGRVGYKDTREKNSRIMLKASSMLNAGDYKAAISLFSKAVEVYPSLARPHLDVAMLLQDHKHDYISAIYHYNKYLEMRPNSEKSAMIVDRIKQSERAFVTRHLAKQNMFGSSMAQLQEENQILVKKNRSLYKKVENLQAELSGINENIRNEYKASVVGEVNDTETKKTPVLKKDPPVKTLPPIEPTAPVKTLVANELDTNIEKVVTSPADIIVETLRSSPREPAKIKTGSSQIQTYTVKRGDSLSEIAFKVYGDPTQWRKIQKANRDTLGATGVNVKVGQVLKVPVP